MRRDIGWEKVLKGLRFLEEKNDFSIRILGLHDLPVLPKTDLSYHYHEISLRRPLRSCSYTCPELLPGRVHLIYPPQARR